MSTQRAPAHSLNWHPDWSSGGDLTLLSSDELAFSVPSRPILAVSPALRAGAGGLLPLPLYSRLVLYFLDLALYGQLDFLGPSDNYLTDVLSLAGWLDSLGCTSLINLLLVSGRAQRWPLAVEFLLGACLRRTDLCREALNRFNDDGRWRDTVWQPPGTVSDFATLCRRALPLELWSSVDRRFLWAWSVADVPDTPPSFGLGDKFLEIYQTP